MRELYCHYLVGVCIIIPVTRTSVYVVLFILFYRVLKQGESFALAYADIGFTFLNFIFEISGKCYDIV